MLTIVAILVLGVYIYIGLKKPAIALITAPFVAAGLLVIGLEEDSAAGAIAPVLFFGTLIVVATSRRGVAPKQWPQRLAELMIIAIGLLIVLFTAGLCLSTALREDILASFVLFMILVTFAGLVVGIIISCGLASHRAIAAYVVSTIGSSMRQNLPLPMALESAASGRADSRSMILQRTKKWLVQGYSLSESIKRGYPKCPGHAVAMIAAAERIDQLPSAMASIEADMVAKADERRIIRPVHPIYPAIVLAFAFFVLLALMTYVIPQFKAVLEEMTEAATLPAATRLLIGIMSFIVYDYGWLIGAALALAVLVVIPVSIYVRFRPRRPQEHYLISRIGDFVKWHLPVLHWFENNYSMVQVVELLRLSLNAGCTVDDAIDSTISLDVNNCFKKRLQRWLEKVKRGDNIAAAVRESKLGSALAWAFDQNVNQGNTLAILETLESFYRSNYSYRVNLARFIMWPCVTLLMGVIVGFVVYAVFSPGIAVIHNLADSVMP